MAIKISNSTIIDDSRNIIDAGSVGIGTTSANGTFEVLDSNFKRAILVRSDGNVTIGSSDADLYAVAQAPTAKIKLNTFSNTSSVLGDIISGPDSYITKMGELLIEGTTPGVAKQAGQVWGIRFHQGDGTGDTTDRCTAAIHAVRESTTNSGTTLDFKTRGSSGGLTTKLRIFSTGVVGIGTTTSTGTESQTLQVSGGAYISDSVGIGTTIPSQKLHILSTSPEGILLERTNDQNCLIQYKNNKGSMFAGLSPNALGWGVDINNNIASLPIFLAQRTGEVLIGGGSSTGTASQNLQVTGGAYISGSVGIATTNPNGILQVGAASTQSFVVTGIGSVGIGRTNPFAKLHITGGTTYPGGEQNLVVMSSSPDTIPSTITVSDSNATLQVFAGGMSSGSSRGGQIDFVSGAATNDPGSLIFRTGTATGGTSQPEVARFSASGNLGIGSTSPISKLEIFDTITSGSSVQSVLVDTYITNPAADFAFAMHIDTNLDGAAATGGDREQGSLYIHTKSDTTGGDTSNEHRVYSLYNNVDVTGDSDLIHPSYNDSLVSHTSGTVSAYYNYDLVQTTSTSTISAMYGRYVLAQATTGATGAITDLIGIRSRANMAGSATPTVGDMIAVWANLDKDSTGAATPSGIIALLYGSYDTFNGFTDSNVWGIYVPQGVKNSFGGPVLVGSATSTGTASQRLQVTGDAYISDNCGIGTTIPSQKLHVIGNILSSGSIDAGTQFLGQANDTYLTPSFSWTGDTDTGLYRPATDQIAIVTAGSTSARFSGNDFEVFQDINAGRVNGYYSSGENGVITTYARNTAWHESTTYSARTQIIPRYTIDDVAVFLHTTKYGIGSTERVYAKIASSGRATFANSVYAGRTETSTTSTPVNYYASGEYAFAAYSRNNSTNPTDTTFNASVNMTARYNIDTEGIFYHYHRTADGSAVDYYTHCLDATGIANHYGNVVAGRSASSSTSPSYYYNPTENSVISYGSGIGTFTAIRARGGSGTDDAVRVLVNNAERFRVEESGRVKVYNNIDVASGYGISFGQAQLLDTYEEGTWTPEVADATTAGNLATGTFTGRYTRIGNIVHLTCDLTNINVSGMTTANDCYIRALPYGVASVTGTQRQMGTGVDTVGITYASSTTLYPLINDATSYIRIAEIDTTFTLDYLTLSEVGILPSNDLRFSFTYSTLN